MKNTPVREKALEHDGPGPVEVSTDPVLRC